MATNNNQFYEYQDHVYKRYRKTVPHIVAGIRNDPYNPGKLISWQLETRQDNFDFADKKLKTFSYGDEVLEIYSEQDDKVFRRQNKILFDRGLLSEYSEDHKDEVSPNDLSDDEVIKVARTVNYKALEKRLRDITSKPTLKRILDTATQHNRSVGIIKVIEARIAEL